MMGCMLFRCLMTGIGMMEKMFMSQQFLLLVKCFQVD